MLQEMLEFMEASVGGETESWIPLKIFGRRRHRMFQRELPELTPGDRIEGAGRAVIYSYAVPPINEEINIDVAVLF